GKTTTEMHCGTWILVSKQSLFDSNFPGAAYIHHKFLDRLQHPIVQKFWPFPKIDLLDEREGTAALWVRSLMIFRRFGTFCETIASLPGFGMAPEGHLSYSSSPNI